MYFQCFNYATACISQFSFDTTGLNFWVSWTIPNVSRWISLRLSSVKSVFIWIFIFLLTMNWRTETTLPNIRANVFCEVKVTVTDTLWRFKLKLRIFATNQNCKRFLKVGQFTTPRALSFPSVDWYWRCRKPVSVPFSAAANSVWNGISETAFYQLFMRRVWTSIVSLLWWIKFLLLFLSLANHQADDVTQQSWELAIKASTEGSRTRFSKEHCRHWLWI